MSCRYRSPQLASLLGVLILSLTACPVAPARTSGAVAREERTVEVAGETESWQLQWASPPVLVCEPGDDVWDTCLCAGFAFGEKGELELLRSGADRTEERLQLTPYFDDQESPGGGDGAVLQRWARLPRDQSPNTQDVHSRPPVPILDLHDYNHDGWATEFVLQVGAGPCGHQASILVGVSRRTPALHAFGTAEHPDKPLTLSPGAWRRLLQAKAPIEIVDVACGDHGASEEGVIQLSADAAGLHALERIYECGDDDRHGKLLREKVL